MKLGARFATRTPVINDHTGEGLSDEQIARVCPSVFATGPFNMKDRYVFVPTSEVLSVLRSEGFTVSMAAQGTSRVPGKSDHTKHMLRMRYRPQDQAAAVDAAARGHVNEVIFVGSADGTTSIHMFGGTFRMACRNGLVVATDLAEEFHTRHSGSAREDTLGSALRIVGKFNNVDDAVEQMRRIVLPEDARMEFARAALRARFGTREDGTAATFVKPEQVLVPLRPEDTGHDLWTTLNVIQEHAVRGGVPNEQPAAKRRTLTRPIGGITNGNALNRALWAIADGWRKLLG